MTTTTLSRTIGGRHVALACAPSRQPLAEDFLAILTRIARDDPLHAGMKVRFGWSILTLRDDGGALVVSEPDFAGDPLRDQHPGVDTTLDVLAQQAALVRRVGATPLDAGFEQFVVVARGALESRTLQLFRSPPQRDDDSGWTISSPEQPGSAHDADAFDAQRVFTLLRQRPVVLSALALPPGFAVIIDGDAISAVFDADGRKRL
ncbi:immunity protein Imm33 domain-containing protein [Aromatoleum buckelii]|uniref:Imm33-like domain-containing protein n=1 Tax=Aromatoleum buckelii TaxID=200254 RepID=A0ABX1N4X0_9RHOO|nr:hypothetical protein [Aromatoleum buckelii]MCK0509709.1 hypothetical protein [Aromatoleum buckelii]